MAFLPVGRRRAMQAQLFKIAEDQLPQPNVDSAYMETGVAAPLPAVGPDMGQSVPMDSVMQNEMGEAGQPTMVDDQQAPSLKEMVFTKLKEIGVKEYYLTDPKISKQIFSKNDSISGEESKGFFVIPSATEMQKITESDAKKMAAEILSAFNLEGSISHEGRNFKITFFSKKAEPEAPSGENDSFSDLVSGGGIPKSASSVFGEMLEMRKNMMRDSLKKAGFLK